jgi:hypothetical protein
MLSAFAGNRLKSMTRTSASNGPRYDGDDSPTFPTKAWKAYYFQEDIAEIVLAQVVLKNLGADRYFEEFTSSAAAATTSTGQY